MLAYLIGDLYGLAYRFVGLLHQREQQADVASMSPVWCFFGGNGAAVLAPAPYRQPPRMDGRDFIAILVPTAPIPFGDALMFVPKEWVRPAEVGVDRLSSVHLSMGMAPPPSPPTMGNVAESRPAAE